MKEEELDPPLFSTIKTIRGFSEFSKETFYQIKDAIDEIAVEKGGVIIKQGQSFLYLYLIIKGKVEIRLTLPNNKKVTVATLAAPDSVGIISAVLNTESTTDVVAAESCKLIRINKSGLEQIFNAHAGISEYFKEQTYRYIKINLITEYLTTIFDAPEWVGQTVNEADLEFVRLERGKILFRENEPSDKIYFVINGRLRATREDKYGNTHVMGHIFVGETIGEIGVYSEQSRIATIQALRDTLLLSATSHLFNKIKPNTPQMSDKILRLVLKRLKEEKPHPTYPPPPKIITIIGIEPNSPEEECAQTLCSFLTRHGKSLYINKALIEESFENCNIEVFLGNVVGEIRMHKWLREKEKELDFLLLIADAAHTKWTQFCLNNADAFVTIAQSNSSPELKKIEKLIYENEIYSNTYKRLLLLRPEGERKIFNTSAWLESRKEVRHHHIRWEAKNSDTERAARFIANKAVGIVLGGGGGRGGAHIGVIKALKEANIAYDYVGGTSIGALMAMGVARDLSSKELEDLTVQIGEKFSLDYTFPAIALTSGKKLNKLMNKACAGTYIEDLPIPFFAVSSNATKAMPIVHKRGKTVNAVLASLALPGIFPPQIIEGDIVVDGAVLNNVPIDIMKEELQGGRIICSDISLDEDMTGNVLPAKTRSGWKILFAKLLGLSSYKIPNIIAILLRSGELASIYADRQKSSKKEVELLFRAPVDKFNLLDMSQMQKLIDLGYQYAKEVLEKREHPW